jgi:hypothetical protein
MPFSSFYLQASDVSKTPGFPRVLNLLFGFNMAACKYPFDVYILLSGALSFTGTVYAVVMTNYIRFQT